MEHGEGGLDFIGLERERRSGSGSPARPGLSGSIPTGSADAEHVTGPPDPDRGGEHRDGVHELGPFLWGDELPSNSAATFLDLDDLLRLPEAGAKVLAFAFEFGDPGALGGV